jgi:preprotein translocase subunit SecF
MSLTDPNILEKIIAAWRVFAYKKILLYAILGLVILGATLFAFDRYGKWRDSRDRTKLQANVNIALKELANVKADVTKDKQDEAVAIEKVKEATNSYIDAQNASTEARNAVNQALVNLQTQVNANKPVGTTAADLERRLNELGVE